MDSTVDKEPVGADESADGDRAEVRNEMSPAARRRARMRVAVLAGMTVGAATVAVIGSGPTTVAGVG